MMACTSGYQQNTVAQRATVTVVITPAGSLSVDGQVVDASTVKRMAAGNGVFVQSAPDLKFPEFQRAMRDLQGLNIPIAIVGEDSK
jgi:hypothetical protein